MHWSLNNQTSASVSFNMELSSRKSLHSFTNDGIYTYTYDLEGNVDTRTKIVGGAYTKYEWDHRNRLISVTDKTSSSGTQTQKVTYTYDAFNRLVKRTHQLTTSDPVTTGYFAYDGDQMVLELESDGDVTHRLLWGPAVDEALADDAAGTTYWYFADHLGTVRDVATYNTTTNITTVANHIAFDSFGKRISETSSSLGDFDIGFTGKWFDRISGLQWNVNRWYNAAIQRWMSEDPIGFGAGDANLYRYVGNSSTTSTDPQGLVDGPPGKDFFKGFDGRILDGKKPGIDKIPTDKLRRYNETAVDNAIKKNKKNIEDAKKANRPDKIKQYEKNIRDQLNRRDNIESELQRRSPKPTRPPFYFFKQLIKLPFMMVLPPDFWDSDGNGVPDNQQDRGGWA